MSTQHLQIFVDEILRADLNLTTFAGGAYASFANGAVGFDGFTGERIQAGGGILWVDNVQVGAAAVPEPGSLALCRLGVSGLLAWRIRQCRLLQHPSA